MAQQTKKPNNFNDRVKIATIIAVDPQKKQVDIKYTTQDGNSKGLNLSYEMCGSTYGRIHMPQINDRVLIDFQQGDKPIIIGMRPANTALLPYLDPGELAELCSDGSYIHWRNQRRRAKSTGELLDFNATSGPNGPTDMELEPGGVVIGVRNPQNRDTKFPRWYEHSYLAMFDNGDISIQARYRSKEKGLLFMDGASGYAIWTAGNGRPQEYIELDPVTKSINIITDGSLNSHAQKDWKLTVYNNQLQNIAGALQINVGVDSSDSTQVNADFTKMNPDSDLASGDIRLTNIKTKNSGKFYLHIKGDVDITTDTGNVNLNVTQGGVVVTAKNDVNVTTQGNTVVNSNGDTSVNASGKVNISGSGGIYLNNGTEKVVTEHDLQNHTHIGVQSGSGVSGVSTYAVPDRKVYMP